MNNAIRKEINKIIDDLASLYSDIETLMDEEQEYLDNIPENLQGSEKYATAEDAVTNLQSALDSLDEACARAIVRAGITLVVYGRKQRISEETAKIFEFAGVQVIHCENWDAPDVTY